MPQMQAKDNQGKIRRQKHLLLPRLPKKMKINRLSLQNFRNFKQKRLEFEAKITVICGDNSTGKSNILEAIYLLATGKSFRAEKDEQMILYGQEFGRVSGFVEQNLDKVEVEVVLTKPKRFFINGVAKRMMDFVGNLNCVLFRPEDIDLVLGSPSGRRAYLDSVLEPVDREYRRCNLSYQKGLRQRNKLLERIRDGQAKRNQLLFWDQILIKNGDIISQKREEFLKWLKLEYDPSRISPLRLNQYSREEVLAATTLVGPHRDDFRFIVQRPGKAAKDLSIYGSRGEQRMAVLGVKLGEFEFVREKAGEKPLLLLDDIFSELDHENRQEIFSLIKQQQTIMTTADKHLIPKSIKLDIETINIKN